MVSIFGLIIRLKDQQIRERQYKAYGDNKKNGIGAYSVTFRQRQLQGRTPVSLFPSSGNAKQDKAKMKDGPKGIIAR